MAKSDRESLSSRLRQRVTLIGPPLDPDRNETGETIDTTAAEAVSIAAEVTELAGRELVYAQQVAAEATSLVTIRFREGVSRFKSLEYAGRTLNIDAAIDDPDFNPGTALKLYCTEEA